MGDRRIRKTGARRGLVGELAGAGDRRRSDDRLRGLGSGVGQALSRSNEDRDTSPASLFARLAQEFPNNRSAWRATFDARFDSLSEEALLAWESFLIDAFAWESTSRLLTDPSVASSFTYLPGLDIPEGTPSRRRRFGCGRDVPALAG